MAKPMEVSHFNGYYQHTHCICGADKPENSSMCGGCWRMLEENMPALLHVIQNGTGDSLLQAMGEFREIVRGAES
jgi:hypothetical protein